MTISHPFHRTQTQIQNKTTSIVIEEDLLDAIDLIRIGENPDRPLSRSGAISHLLTFAIALHVDDDAIQEFCAEHAKAAGPVHPPDHVSSMPTDLGEPS